MSDTARQDGGDPATDDVAAADPPEPRWWHRDHPTFTAITGFFAGLVFVVLVPGLFAAVLSAVFDYETAESLFPFGVLLLAVPIGLAAAPRTRRFGLFMLLGAVSSAVVVAVVTAVVLAILVRAG